jgi:hypothetical protein
MNAARDEHASPESPQKRSGRENTRRAMHCEWAVLVSVVGIGGPVTGLAARAHGLMAGTVCDDLRGPSSAAPSANRSRDPCIAWRRNHGHRIRGLVPSASCKRHQPMVPRRDHGHRRRAAQRSCDRREPTRVAAGSSGHESGDRGAGPVTGPPMLTTLTRTAHSQCIAPRECSFPDLIFVRDSGESLLMMTQL